MKKVAAFREVFFIFWEEHPALLTGLLFLFGVFVSFGHLCALVPTAWIFFTLRRPLLLTIFFLVVAYIPAFYQIPERPSEGKGLFSITAVSPAKREGWVYRGILHQFIDESFHCVAQKIPCRMFSKSYYTPTHRYIVDGTLAHRQGFFLKSKKEWIPREIEWNWTEGRFKAKEKMRNYLAKSFRSERVGSFLGGIVTGEMKDRQLYREFGQLGLSHLMAISGFHFSLLILFFHLFLRRIFPPKACALALIVLLTCYLFFLGSAPSVQRAWIGSTLFLLAQTLQRRSLPLNSLGCALIVAILVDPHTCFQLGFQLSFLATGSLLLLFHPLDVLMQSWLPKRPFHLLVNRSTLFQWAYIFRSLFRESLALTGAVHLALLPVLLYCFHQFSWHSLFYNLFYPLLVSLSLFILLFTMPFDLLLPPLAKSLHSLNLFYTDLILSLVENPPFLTPTWYVENISEGFVIWSLTCLFATGIFLKGRKKGEQRLLAFQWI